MGRVSSPWRRWGVVGEGDAGGEVERVGRQVRYLGDVDVDLAGADYGEEVGWVVEDP